ncbi:glycosyltransferase family 39 protein [Streptomyces sp. NPDC060194]|uniref:glycosyltransferase family 39 protein n=1 Tax=Streptomyces sp. NPDC060194 TaxID=3347069 RepID=UPI00364828B9
MTLDAPARRRNRAPSPDPAGAPGGRAAARRAREKARQGARGPGRGGRAVAAGLFLLPTALALALILPGIGDRQLWRDEHATWWAATLSMHDLSVLIRTIDVVFTPYYVAMHAWIAATGDSETALRIPAAVAMACSAGLLALLGRRMFVPRVGLIAGLAYAVVPTVTRFGQEIRPYAFAVAAVLLSTVLLCRALDRPTFRVWVGYTVSVPLVGWSHLASLAVLAAHLVIVLTARRDGDRIAGWAYAAAAGLGVCFVLPMALSGSGQSGQIAWNNPGRRELLDFPTNLFGSWEVAAPVMALGLLGLCFAGRRALPLAVWVLAPPALTYATAAQLHLFLPRYLLFTAPAWVLLAAVLIGRLGGPVTGPKALRPGGGRAAWRALATLLALAAVAGLGLRAQPGIEAARRHAPSEPDFRGAARFIEARQKPGDGIAFSGVQTERRALDYEFRANEGRPEDVLMYRTPRQTGRFDADECPRPAECLLDTRRLWLVATALDMNPYTDMPPRTAAVIRRDFRVVETEKLANVQVLLFERAAPKGPGKGAADREVHS